MNGLEYIRTYINNLLVLTKRLLKNYLEKLDKVFQRMKKTGLKVNTVKSPFCQEQLEYLDYWITRKNIQLLPKKIETIHKITVSKTKKELRFY